MEQVWVTRAGSRYHAERTCPGLTEGQAKAASEGFLTHSAELVGLDQVPRRSPCSRCWPTRSEWDDWKRLEHRTVQEGDSNYEYEFLHRVLKAVKGVEPYFVRFQHEVTGSAGRNFRVDFALLPPGRDRIAIEIDGFDKTSAGNVATKEHQDSDSSRRAELEIAGWRVLSFTNRQVQVDPGECRRKIENMLLGSTESAWDRSATMSWGTGTGEQTGTLTFPAVTGTGVAEAAGAPQRRSRLIGLTAAVAVVLVVFGVVGGLWLASDDSVDASGASGPTNAEPNGANCPADFPVKGNVNDSGERIFHEPGWQYYAATWPEECFGSSGEAEAAGYRASEIQ
jgi:very-short-patch-repair endonuclease